MRIYSDKQAIKAWQVISVSPSTNGWVHIQLDDSGRESHLVGLTMTDIFVSSEGVKVGGFIYQLENETFMYLDSDKFHNRFQEVEN